MFCQGWTTTLDVVDKWYHQWDIRGLSNIFNNKEKSSAIMNRTKLVFVKNVWAPIVDKWSLVWNILTKISDFKAQVTKKFEELELKTL